MHYCINCGSKLPESNPNFCSNCGFNLSSDTEDVTAAFESGTITFDPASLMKKRSPEFAPAGLNKATFFKRYSRGRQKCLTAAILCYISAGATTTAITSKFVEFINYMAYFDVIFIIALSLLIHILCSRIASVILLIYTLSNMLFIVITLGRFGGWWGVIAGVLAVIGSFQCVKEWKTYQARTQNAAQFF